MLSMSQTAKATEENVKVVRDNEVVHGRRKRSILDPHLSVLEILGRQDLDNVVNEVEVSGMKIEQLGLPMQNSISKSWQTIKKTDYSFISNNAGEYTLQHTTVGILSSSDTSEEEQEIRHSPPPNFCGSGLGNNMKLAGPTLSAPLPQSAGQDLEDDGETVTMSFPDTTSSLVMPKLSLSHRACESKVLLVGQPARKFWVSIPKSYQKMFDVGSLGAVTASEIAHRYFAIMVVFHEISAAKALLEELTHKLVRPTIIPICQKGQRHHLSSLLKKFTDRNRIKLLCGPITMSNHHEKHRLLKGLFQIYNGLESGYETEAAIESYKKLPKKSKKRPSKPGILRDWVLWTASVTVGVGIGCCISLMLSTRYTFVSPHFMTIDDVDTAALPVAAPSGKPSHRFVHQVYTICKSTIDNLSSTLKLFLTEKLDYSRTWFHTLAIELNHDDSWVFMNRMMPLDFITL